MSNVIRRLSPGLRNTFLKPFNSLTGQSAVRQLVETVKILSKDEVAVTLKGGIEICQKIMY